MALCDGTLSPPRRLFPGLPRRSLSTRCRRRGDTRRRVRVGGFYSFQKARLSKGWHRAEIRHRQIKEKSFDQEAEIRLKPYSVVSRDNVKGLAEDLPLHRFYCRGLEITASAFLFLPRRDDDGVLRRIHAELYGVGDVILLEGDKL